MSDQIKNHDMEVERILTDTATLALGLTAQRDNGYYTQKQYEDRFEKYIKQGTKRIKDLQSARDAFLQIEGGADEIKRICDEVGLFTKKRNKAVYNVQLPIAHLINRGKELKAALKKVSDE
jgi:hypothetical protein